MYNHRSLAPSQRATSQLWLGNFSTAASAHPLKLPSSGSQRQRYCQQPKAVWRHSEESSSSSDFPATQQNSVTQNTKLKGGEGSWALTHSWAPWGMRAISPDQWRYGEGSQHSSQSISWRQGQHRRHCHTLPGAPSLLAGRSQSCTRWKV